jgi:glycosyltransferase involved in cell wall biosynthesis
MHESGLLNQVCVNGRFAGKRLTGVQRYAVELVARLGSRCRVIHTTARDGIEGHRWEQFNLPFLRSGQLLWSPCNTGPLAVRRQVLTIHDATFADTPECFGRAFATWYGFLIPRLARRVRRVVTVSDFSRRRIAETTGLKIEQIDVVPNGVDARFMPATMEAISAFRSKLGLDGPFILALGSVEPRKNLVTLLKAWRILSQRRSDLTLAIAGGSNLSIFSRDGLDADSLPRVKRLGYVDDADLPALYSSCEAFVFPSTYEGFGLPPLEAMACGVPVVCSNTTALPEVVADAALLVPPLDAEAIADAALRVCSDSELRQRLLAAGRLRAAQFTWEKSADLIWQILSREAADS